MPNKLISKLRHWMPDRWIYLTRY